MKNNNKLHTINGIGYHFHPKKGYDEAKKWLMEVGEWDYVSTHGFSVDGWSVIATANSLWDERNCGENILNMRGGEMKKVIYNGDTFYCLSGALKRSDIFYLYKGSYKSGSPIGIVTEIIDDFTFKGEPYDLGGFKDFIGEDDLYLELYRI